MRTFVVGDVHGADRALEQVIERSGIDTKNDELICLGDVADGWSGVPRCFDLLLEFDNLVYILGNHDIWFRDWFLGSISDMDLHGLWLPQGGRATYEAYGKEPTNVPEEHKNIVLNAVSYHIRGNECFVHGGIPWYTSMGQNMLAASEKDFAWDRDMAYDLHTKSTIFDRVYIGHTQHRFNGPLVGDHVTNMDSSAGWDGVLTIMDVDSEEYWISDNVLQLYPDEVGRRR